MQNAPKAMRFPEVRLLLPEDSLSLSPSLSLSCFLSRDLTLARSFFCCCLFVLWCMLLYIVLGRVASSPYKVAARVSLPTNAHADKALNSKPHTGTQGPTP